MNKRAARSRRRLKCRYTIESSKRARLVVFRSLSHTYAQIVIKGKLGDEVLVYASTVDKEIKEKLKGNKVDQATQVGKLLGQRAKEKNIEHVAFDRAGFKYHGRVKALADGAREAGLNF